MSVAINRWQKRFDPAQQSCWDNNLFRRILLITVLLLSLYLSLQYFRTDAGCSFLSNTATSATWSSGSNSRKVFATALILYSRRHSARVLDKYLKQNLVSAGGILEEVIWMNNARDPEDDHWLQHTLLPSEPNLYKMNVISGPDVPTEAINSSSVGLSSVYKGHDPDKYYIKLDDDIMFIRKGSFEAMLQEKQKDRFWLVSANVVNHPILSRVHAAMGFLKTYKQEGREYFPTDDIFLDSSPFRDMPDDPYSECSLFSAECAAITHYNFLDNVKIPHEAGLDKYDFNTWDFDAFGYPRWSINAFVFKGSDLIDEHISNEDDEQDIAVELPKAKGKHCGAVGKALIVHLSYVFQRQAGFDKQTNLAAHYVALARNLTGPLLDV